MAQKVSVVMTDDLDGSDATETIHFSLDGTNYEIDLNAKNAAALRKALEKYTEAGRKVRGASARGRAKSSSDVDPKAVRAWAASHKIDVPARGRIPGSVIEKYKAAGN